MTRRSHKRLGVACLWLAASVLLAGCSNAVVSQDRAPLWQAAVLAVEQQGFTITEENAARGYLVGTYTAVGDNQRQNVYRLELHLRPLKAGYEAYALVHRTWEPVKYELTDALVGSGEVHRGSERGALTEFASTTTRDTRIEADLRDRIRANLRPFDPAHAGPP